MYDMNSVEILHELPTFLGIYPFLTTFTAVYSCLRFEHGKLIYELQVDQLQS